MIQVYIKIKSAKTVFAKYAAASHVLMLNARVNARIADLFLL
jgi:hypothetical protein